MILVTSFLHTGLHCRQEMWKNTVFSRKELQILLHLVFNAKKKNIYIYTMLYSQCYVDATGGNVDSQKYQVILIQISRSAAEEIYV